MNMLTTGLLFITTSTFFYQDLVQEKDKLPKKEYFLGVITQHRKQMYKMVLI